MIATVSALPVRAEFHSNQTCRHCGHATCSRPRGLCWTCYYNPQIRDQYPTTSKFGRRGPGQGNANAKMPMEPTNALPGSPEKVEVLIARAMRREALFDPRDAGGVMPIVGAGRCRSHSRQRLAPVLRDLGDLENDRSDLADLIAM